jgi:hypothetical protein
MASPESHPGGDSSEQESEVYYQAARFPGERPAGKAYFAAQELLFTNTENNLSAYRFLLYRLWHVAVLGDPPHPNLAHQLQEILAAGEPVSLPADIVQVLYERRQQAKRLGPWVEGHRQPDE